MMELDNLPSTNRYKLLKMLGGKCRICPVSEIKYLEVDHIYNDGADERTKYGSSEKIYGWYLQHENQAFRRLQPLCKEHHEEKHHPIMTYGFGMPRGMLDKDTTFMSVLEILEKGNSEPVERSILIQELIKTREFTEEESKNYIQRYLREASIYESKIGCYNRV